MRIEVPEAKKLVYEMSFSIRWADLDAMGHVNNVSYFRYLEDARVAWMMSLGYLPSPVGESYVIVNAFCNFKHQLEFPGEVLARLYVANPGRTSFDHFVTFSRADAPDRVCASGGATTVWVDFPRQQAVALPEALRRVLG